MTTAEWENVVRAVYTKMNYHGLVFEYPRLAPDYYARAMPDLIQAARTANDGGVCRYPIAYDSEEP